MEEHKQIVPKNPDGTFVKGYRPAGANQGRPKGSVSGRSKALAALDAMLGEESEIKSMIDALRAAKHRDEEKFFRNITAPLLPQEMKHEISAAGELTWGLLSTTQRTRVSNGSTIQELASESCAVAVGGARPLELPPTYLSQPETSPATTPG